MNVSGLGAVPRMGTRVQPLVQYSPCTSGAKQMPVVLSMAGLLPRAHLQRLGTLLILQVSENGEEDSVLPDSNAWPPGMLLTILHCQGHPTNKKQAAVKTFVLNSSFQFLFLYGIYGNSILRDL